MTSPTEELRAAVATIRARAEEVITGDGELLGTEWFADHSSIPGARSDIVARDEGTVIAHGLLRREAEHIATWSPRTALAVAAWLDATAAWWESIDIPDPHGLEETPCNDCAVLHAALAVARAIGWHSPSSMAPTSGWRSPDGYNNRMDTQR